MIQKLYANCRRFLRLDGKWKYAFTPKSGTKQGCPLPGTIFVILLDPIIAALTKSMGPKDVLLGYADDLAAVLFIVIRTLRRIACMFQPFKIIRGLNLKISKTVIIPLGRQGAFKAKASICDSLLHWTGVLVHN